MLEKTKQYINGQWIESHSNETIDVINPATEEVFGKIANGNAQDVEDAVNAADSVYLEFRNSSIEYRKILLNDIVKEYENRKDDLVKTMTLELGVPVTASKNVQYEMGLAHFKAARDALDTLSFRERRGNNIIIKEAIGVSGLITPWNFPTNQTSLKLAGAFAAGSTVVLKPSEETPFSAIILAEIFDKVGVPAGVFNLINGDGMSVGNPISENKKIRMMSFTGSGNTGSKIMEIASKDFKKVSLELGGKSPYVVLEDADLDKASDAAVHQAVDNSGQVCIAGSRIIIPESIKEEFTAKVKDKMAGIHIGDPQNMNVEMGPVINAKQYNQIQKFIEIGIEEGATLELGGTGKPEGLETGYFVQPTIFSNVDNNMTIAQEEIFGPVMSIITYSDLDEAIKIANDTKYGLAGYVYGKDIEALQHVATSLEAGVIEINGAPRSWDLPFGGYKQSGIGREWGDYGIEEFLEIKSISGYFQ